MGGKKKWFSRYLSTISAIFCELAPVHDEARNKMLGGCATVAGWGNRYSKDEMEESDSSCTTDFSNTSPDKLS